MHLLDLNLKRIVSRLAIGLLALGIIGCSHSDSKVTLETAPKLIKANQLPHYSKRSITEEVFYFVLPDRFDNGDRSNDQGAIDYPLSYGGFDPTNPKAYHGGDLKGLINNLDYIENMGVTAIWLTPILRNQAQQGDISGYHGYWVLDFTQLDPHLGSNDDLKAFIDAAHGKNMKVFFDIITNHTADVIKFKECHGENGAGWSESGQPCPYISKAELAEGKSYSAIVPKGSENAKTPKWLNNPKYYHNQGDSTFSGESSLYGDFAGLDDLDTANPEVVQGMIDIYSDIITSFKPDGFRIDTVKHVHLSFWQQFAPAIQKHAQQIGINNFFMFGEVWEYSVQNLAKYTTKGKLPSVLDFALQSALYQTLIEDKGTDVFKALFSQDHLYRNAYELLTFTGNHDMGRFAHLLWSKRPELTEREVLERLKLAHSILFLTRGVPVIYYGDEQGFVGDGNDIMARQNMFASQVSSYNDDDLLGTNQSTASRNFDTSHELYQHMQQLSILYRDNEALRIGQQNIVWTSDESGLFIFDRVTDSQDLRVVVNTSDKAKSIDMGAENWEIVYPIGNSDLELKNRLSPMAFAVFNKKQKASK